MLGPLDKKFDGGWWWHCNYSFKLQVQVRLWERPRSRDFSRPWNLTWPGSFGPGPELDKKGQFIIQLDTEHAVLQNHWHSWTTHMEHQTSLELSCDMFSKHNLGYHKILQHTFLLTVLCHTNLYNLLLHHSLPKHRHLFNKFSFKCTVDRAIFSE